MAEAVINEKIHASLLDKILSFFLEIIKYSKQAKIQMRGKGAGRGKLLAVKTTSHTPGNLKMTLGLKRRVCQLV